MNMHTPELYFNYKFSFSDGRKKEFKVKIDNSTLTSILPQKETLPEWTKLENFKCSHCPLDSTKNEYCPVAVSLIDIIEFFSDSASYESCDLTIETEPRNYSKHTSLQTGVSGLIGILMVTSGCPVMGKLKPMVRFHLPFGTLEETEYRVLSMYLLAQYLIWKKGGTPDWEMQNLSKIYDDIRILNQNVCKRIADLEAKDTSINAVVVLNNFAEYVSFNLDEKMLDELEVLFKDYFNSNQ